jgi:hypothetical protein
VTRTLVEDSLCEWFGNASDRVVFDAETSPESFNLDTTAVKLRIQVDLLLTMVESRVNERDGVMNEIPDWEVTYALVEGAPSPANLNEMELNVLHFVDGRKNVSDIAMGMRESCINAACYLLSLQMQGFISKAVRPSSAASGRRPAASGASQAVQPEPTPAQAAAAIVENTPVERATLTADINQGRQIPRMPSTAPAMAEKQVVVRRNQPTRSRAPMVLILLAVLGVLGWVGWMVMEARKRNELVENLRNEIESLIEAQSWQAAAAKLSSARDKAGNDLSLQRRLDEFIAAQQVQSAGDLDGLAKAIEEERLGDAKRLSQLFPDDPTVAEGLWNDALTERLSTLRLDLEDLEVDLIERTQVFRRQVNDYLNGGLVTVALARIDEAHPRLKEVGDEALSEWRVQVLTEAGDASRSLDDRVRLIGLVRQARPSDDNATMIADVERDVARVRAEVVATENRMKSSLAAGDYASVLTDANGALELASGSEIAKRIEGLRDRAAELKASRDSLVARGAKLAETSRDPSAISALQAEVDGMIEALPKLTGREELVVVSRLMAALVDSLSRETTADELAALSVIADVQPADGAVAQALAARREELETREERAQREVASARDLFNRGDLDQAEAAFRAVVAREDYRRTASFIDAEVGLAEVTAERRRRAARMGALRTAMLAGDIDQVTRLGRELALPRLPLLISSEPVGATVVVDGKELGVTPLIIEDLAPDRVETEFTISMDGFEPMMVSSADAAAGWKVAVDLIRAPARDVALKVSVTSRPAAIDDKLYVTGSRAVYAIGLDGSVATVGLDAGGALGRSLREPVYAPAIKEGEGIYVTTRDRIALRIRDGKIERLPLAGETNFALGRYVSPLVLDREVLIVAGLDKRPAASDNQDSPMLWTGAIGAEIACSPVVVGDSVMVLRIDGNGELYACDTGSVTATVSMDGRVVDAWRDGETLVAVTPLNRAVWDGEAVTMSEPFPQTVIRAGPGVVVSADRQVHIVADDGTWTSLGKIEANRKLTAPPLRWGDSVVITTADEISVYGAKSFSIALEHEALPAALFNGHLVVGDVSGRIRIYAP